MAATAPLPDAVAGARFERAADAVVHGEVGALRALLAEDAGLAVARSPRPHHATLLHYLGANGLEAERQKTPPNAVEIARTLVDAGAEVDALCGLYRGCPGQTTLSLLVTSSHPVAAGSCAALVQYFASAGAALDGLDGDGGPLAGAIVFACTEAAEALVDAGARLSNILFAAMAGRVDLVEKDLVAGPRLRDGAARCPALGMPRDPAAAVQQALLIATRFGRRNVVELLLDRGVDVNAAPIDGIAALHEAAYTNQRELVLLLLERGADPCLRDARHGGWPAGWARANGNRELAELLQMEGERQQAG